MNTTANPKVFIMSWWRRGGGGVDLQSDHLVLWSADNIIAESSKSKYLRRGKWAGRGNNSITEKIISCLFVFLAYHICPLVLKLQNASYSHCNCVFSTKNKACWTISWVYRLHRFCWARTSEDYRSYDADKNSWVKCQTYWK